MGRGYGQVQLEILALLSDPDGAWTTTELCQLVYGIEQVEKRHRVAVARAVKKISSATPDWFYVGKPGGENLLFNKYSVAGRIRWRWFTDFSDMNFDTFRASKHFGPIANEIAANVEKAKRFRDADELGKLDMLIEDVAEKIGLAESARDKDRANELKRKRSQLVEQRRSQMRRLESERLHEMEERRFEEMLTRPGRSRHK
jgi:hypothetical protein